VSNEYRFTRFANQHKSSLMADGPDNRLLATLSSDDFRWLESQLERVELPQGTVLAEEGEVLSNTYFPHTAVVSLVRQLKDGRVVEMATFGREGLVGLAFVGIPLQSFGRYIVQMSGAASHIGTTRLQMAARVRPGIQDMMLRYTEMLMALTLQSVACNAVHSVEVRACRWISATRDRVGRDDIPLTHEFLAEMLGVQRSTVSDVLRTLQSRGLIHQGRGKVTVNDGPRLQQAACECYRILRGKYQQLLPVAER
jgi:CRP-like cAMP-binding protein